MSAVHPCYLHSSLLDSAAAIGRFLDIRVALGVSLDDAFSLLLNRELVQVGTGSVCCD